MWFMSYQSLVIKKLKIKTLGINKWISRQSICHKSPRLSLDSQHQSGNGSTLVSLSLCKQRQEDPWDSLAIYYCRISELQAQWETSPPPQNVKSNKGKYPTSKTATSDFVCIYILVSAPVHTYAHTNTYTYTIHTQNLIFQAKIKTA